MASRKAPAKRPGWTKAARGVFLAELAETANVAASARKAGMPASSVYALRIKSPEFRLEWSEALAEGYARLEASLLEAALGKGPDTADPDGRIVETPGTPRWPVLSAWLRRKGNR